MHRTSRMPTIPDPLNVHVTHLPPPAVHEHLYRLRVSFDNMGYETTGSHEECITWLGQLMRRVVLPDNGIPWMTPLHVFCVDHMGCIQADCPNFR